MPRNTDPYRVGSGQSGGKKLGPNAQACVKSGPQTYRDPLTLPSSGRVAVELIIVNYQLSI